ncbi:RimK family alpha-L-glutamate ligase [Mycoplasmoides genitalium]|uniref:Uncharacterized protein MG012 n=2 Tax=Mycoplasmoides genitalium TaxID=2097 RepID=Y012_MYCGE|nr:RimK family alpha-L-glutamate ligase [Mycoplasmoides genitalium]P47258.2 RecName: Full=Uncharacterized protein MG012 [Mycoplasmoides genitalium G37]ABY79610.1 alpha-L-glutamate ligase, RimK family, putative [synthetic Mycoplasma genitalium JCVI-1.0]AAC71228.1 alpha-L-glutamate ligases, RimK family, putative [Mycoplasmoides genitalium G37]AFQ02823.1 alpha-L-glutamate ligase [Mycoplasmoides genitalium M2321]AFQ03806.1 alpha-L-glutamate ligase [Mycoplasmoides genitalium M6320]
MKKINVVYNPAFNPISSKLNQTQLLKNASEELDIELKFFTSFDINTTKAKANLPFISNKILFMDKNIALARWLESNGFEVINSSIGINNADNKGLSHAIIAQYPFIKQIKTLLGPQNFDREWNPVMLDVFINQIKQSMEFPVIVKSVFGSFGDYVFLCLDEQKLRKTLMSFNQQAIVQKYITCSKGESVRVIVVNNKVIGALHTTNNSDFRSNLNKGAKAERFFLNKEQENLAVKISKVMQLFYCGIDFLFDQDRSLIFCEVNPNVQLTRSSMYLNTNLAIELLKAI